MIRKSLFLFLGLLIIGQQAVKAQFSTENSGEFIFAFSNIERLGVEVPSKMRFTCFFHIGQNYHYDFTNNFGVFTGYGVRNIGIVSDENGVITKRRTYSLGVPLAVKLGSFKDHLYIYSGGEYELFFHYKQKQIIDGSKEKQTDWFSNRTRRFAPSYFVGVQFPKGINLKFKYYPENFLNTSYRGKDFGVDVNYSDFNKTQLFYISLSFNFQNKDLKKIYNPDPDPGRMALLKN
ncbi:MAG: hypothetical protein H6538_03740 [Bacteroidales bacterium]|nr:hypothetical protein [Bacteroidales bacterium]